MNRDELLTLLAMELAEWPRGTSAYPEYGHWMKTFLGELVYADQGCAIFRKDWLQRRKELINEPDDKDAPVWAEWVAQDSSGVWFFTKREPFIDNALDCFVYRGYSTDVKYGPKGCIPAGHDWRKTKRRVVHAEKPITRKAADGVNTETLHPDGMIISTMVHKHDTSEYEKAQFDESRIDAIGQNGGDGLHYAAECAGQAPGMDKESIHKIYGGIGLCAPCDAMHNKPSEEDEARIDQALDQIFTHRELGKKLDDEKPRFDLLPPHALTGVARVLTFGAQKYAPDNWRKVPDARRRYIAAAYRHLTAILAGEELDDETGEKHSDHLACCAMFLSEVGYE